MLQNRLTKLKAAHRITRERSGEWAITPVGRKHVFDRMVGRLPGDAEPEEDEQQEQEEQQGVAMDQDYAPPTFVPPQQQNARPHVVAINVAMDVSIEELRYLDSDTISELFRISGELYAIRAKLEDNLRFQRLGGVDPTVGLSALLNQGEEYV